MKCKWLLLALAAVIGLGWTNAASAAVIVNDTWIDGTDDDPAAPTYSEYGVDSDSDGNIESVWFQGGGGTLNPAGAGGPLRGTGYGTSSASWTTFFTPEANKINLANDGDKLRITWAFTLDGLGTGNTSQNHRFAVVNTPNGSRVTSNASPNNGAYTGYAMFMNMGPTLQNGNSFQLRERSAAGDLLSTSGNWAALSNGAGNGTIGYANGVLYTHVIEFTRNGTALDIVSTVSGGNLGGVGFLTTSFSDPTPSTFVFDTFGIRPQNTATTAVTFDTSLFRVEFFTIPEPTSIGLLGLSALALGLRRSR